MKKKFNNLKKSFRDACRGLVYIFRYEVNFRIQVIVGFLAIIFVFVLPTRKYEQIIVIMMVALVLILELANSVMERLIDLFQPKIDHIAKVVKDIMAAAVLVAALLSIVLGLMIFCPYLANLLKL